MPYMTKSWKVARERSPFLPTHRRNHDEFDKMLRDCARAPQIAFVQIMQRYDGNPSGIEYRFHSDNERWAFVLPDATQEGFRVQFFDTRGFSGHSHFDDLEAAVDEMVTRGYRIEDVGALDRLSQTPSWAEGMAWLERLHSQCPAVLS